MDFNELQVGAQYTLGPVRMDLERMLAFAREFDPLEFHTDEEYAKTTRYGGLIAPGVYSFMAVWSDFIRNKVLGDSIIAGKSSKIEWLAPVRPGDVLRGDMTVTGKTRRNRYNGVGEFTTNFYNQDGALVMRNVTEIVLSGEEEGGCDLDFS